MSRYHLLFCSLTLFIEVILGVRALSYTYEHGDALHVAVTPRTFIRIALVWVADVSESAPVTHATWETLAEKTTHRMAPMTTERSPSRLDKPSPCR